MSSSITIQNVHIYMSILNMVRQGQQICFHPFGFPYTYEALNEHIECVEANSRTRMHCKRQESALKGKIPEIRLSGSISVIGPFKDKAWLALKEVIPGMSHLLDVLQTMMMIIRKSGLNMDGCMHAWMEG